MTNLAQQILTELAQGERTACELAQSLQRPRTSINLKLSMLYRRGAIRQQHRGRYEHNKYVSVYSLVLEVSA